jgi:hypothetical protein
MSTLTDIDQLLSPSILTSFRENMPPVRCIIWKGGETYEQVDFTSMFPFDTLYDIKRRIATRAQKDINFHPLYTFIGVPLGSASETTDPPTDDTTYIPLDFLWYSIDKKTSSSRSTIILPNPRKNITVPDRRFITSDGSFPRIESEPRGRSTLEDVFLKQRDGVIPTLHVFTLDKLLEEYRGPQPVAEDEWNKRFAPYFPMISPLETLEPSDEDRAFLKTIYKYTTRRYTSLRRINKLLEEGGMSMPTLNVTGIKMLRLQLNKPVEGFEGCESLFYRLKTTKQRPYMRILPANSTPITKVLIKGVLPIPALEDPQMLLQWSKDISVTPGHDYMYSKFIFRQSQGSIPPIYGTIRVMEEGTAHILLQPPKKDRVLEPTLDFRYFGKIMEGALEDMPQTLDEFTLGEIALVFNFSINPRSEKFTAKRLRSRLPFFQSFFEEIKPLPTMSPDISLRYKAVSLYAKEDTVFTFISQYTSKQYLNGEMPDDSLIDQLQEQFQITRDKAIEYIDNFREQSATFTVTNPEENEFMESFNPGIDIHIYAKHPIYTVHAHRVDSYDTFQRLYTLLSMFFIEENDVFKTSSAEETEYAEESDKVERHTVEEDTGRSAPPGSAMAEGTSGFNAEDIDEDDIPEDVRAMLEAQAQLGLAKESIPPATAEEASRVFTAKPDKTFKPSVVSVSAPTSVSVPEPTKRTAPEPEEEKAINPYEWFINKLKRIDERLFAPKSEESKSVMTKSGKRAKKDEQGYSRICQANDDRQPAVLTTEQYDAMIEEYENDDNVFFITYPIKDTKVEAPPMGAEVYTLLEFGSDPSNKNYYFCPQYFCLADEIMIRPRDFEATRDRDGNPKPKNTCPFCYGRLIVDKTTAMKGHTVIRRRQKPKSDKRHLYPGFVKKTLPPEHFKLPCCFTDEKVLRISNPAFDHLRRAVSKREDLNEDEEEGEEETEEKKPMKRTEAIEYQAILQTMHTIYILGAIREILEPGKVALVPNEFDKFFGQDSLNIVARTAIRQDLRDKSEGFLRIGTDNTNINESLLGALAPLLFKNSIEEVKERILEVCVPRVFISANFGNLVLEFYNPADASIPVLTENGIRLWASNELKVAPNANNMLQIQRVYNAYKRFEKFIKDPTQRKELRHITPLLAEGLLTYGRGLNLLIVDWDSNDRSGEALRVRCPSYGFSMDRHKRNDVAFISRDQTGMFEIFVYTMNKPAKGGDEAVHQNILRWENAKRNMWPKIVRDRVDEFYTQCASQYRSVYMSEEGVDPMALIPLSECIRASPVSPYGVVRDSYNHASSLLYRSRMDSKLSPFVAVPVVDDGYLATELPIYLDWHDFTPAPVDEIVTFYKTNIEKIFGLYPGYSVKLMVQDKDRGNIIAVQLANGIHIPATAPAPEKIEELGLAKKEVEELEWSINDELLLKPCEQDGRLSRRSSTQQLDELYQHFRISVANWLASPDVASSLRKNIERVITAKLPTFEKRKRLDLMIGSIFKSWFFMDPEEWEMPRTFMRKDCRIIDEKAECTGVCEWVEEGSPQCRLHIEETSKLGSTHTVSTAQLFVKRLIDELIRFPKRREQLMKRRISTISGVMEPIIQGDQYIIPEYTPTWINLLRMDWAGVIPEKPMYYEEMYSKLKPMEGERKAVPDELREVIGDESTLFLWRPEYEEQPLLPFVPIIGTSLESLGINPMETKFTKSEIEKIVSSTLKTFGVIDLTGEASSIYFIGPIQGSVESVTIFVFLSDGTSGLLIEKAGVPTVNINNLPENLLPYFQKRQRLFIRRKEPKPEGKKTIKILRRAPVVQPVPETVPLEREENESIIATAPPPAVSRSIIEASRATTETSTESAEAEEESPETSRGSAGESPETSRESVEESPETSRRSAEAKEKSPETSRESTEESSETTNSSESTETSTSTESSSEEVSRPVVPLKTVKTLRIVRPSTSITASVPKTSAAVPASVPKASVVVPAPVPKTSVAVPASVPKASVVVPAPAPKASVAVPAPAPVPASASVPKASVAVPAPALASVPKASVPVATSRIEEETGNNHENENEDNIPDNIKQLLMEQAKLRTD